MQTFLVCTAPSCAAGRCEGSACGGYRYSRGQPSLYDVKPVPVEPYQRTASISAPGILTLLP
eukprot:7125649-Prymnesium_polylepis.1